MADRRLALVRQAQAEAEQSDQERRDLLKAQSNGQSWDAVDDIRLPADAYLRMPYTALDDVLGGMPCGEVNYVCAFSGAGKTTFAMNVTNELLKQGKRVYYMGLETSARKLCTRLACLRLGIHDGAVLTGDAKLWPDWPQHQERLELELAKQSYRLESDAYTVMFDDQRAINTSGLRNACQNAVAYGADLVVVDHIDQVSLGDRGTSLWEESAQVNRLALELAEQYQLRLLLTSQCNMEALRGDRLGQYQPPQPHHVRFPGIKRDVATWMIGLFRPMKATASMEDVAAVRKGQGKPSDVLEPNTMGVVVLKHRHYGDRETWRRSLRVERGLVSDIPTFRSLT